MIAFHHNFGCGDAIYGKKRITMRNYFKSYLKRYDEPARIELLDAFDKLYSPELENLVELYEDIAFDYKSAIESVTRLGEERGVGKYTSNFVYVILLTQKMREYYLKNGYTEEFFEDNVKDFDYKLEECRLVKGCCGSFCAEWFEGHFKLERFKLGRLQFEIKRFPEMLPEITRYEKDGRVLTSDSPMINVHIPRSGERLDEESVKDAFLRAVDFYKDVFKDSPVAFCCASWLLYPKNAEIMREGSNLRRFFELFDIIKSRDYEDYSECWRLFDMDYTGDPDDLPGDSSLRRAYKELMKRGEKTGWGFGIHLYNK